MPLPKAVPSSTVIADPHGYQRLYRSLEFIAQECRLAGDDEATADVERAMAFASGSPSEFLGEAEIVLRRIASSRAIGRSTARFADAMAMEIRSGFDRVGGG